MMMLILRLNLSNCSDFMLLLFMLRPNTFSLYQLILEAFHNYITFIKTIMRGWWILSVNSIFQSVWIAIVNFFRSLIFYWNTIWNIAIIKNIETLAAVRCNIRWIVLNVYLSCPTRSRKFKTGMAFECVSNRAHAAFRLQHYVHIGGFQLAIIHIEEVFRSDYRPVDRVKCKMLCQNSRKYWYSIQYLITFLVIVSVEFGWFAA